jgi:hypothetical protein
VTGYDDVAATDPGPTIDRDLMARDLERFRSGLLEPLMLAGFGRLKALRVRVGFGLLSRELPIGEWVLAQLRAYLPRATSDAMAAVQNLPDGELYALSVAIAGELGAWCRAAPPLTDDQIRAAAPAVARLLGTVDELEQAAPLELPVLEA